MTSKPLAPPNPAERVLFTPRSINKVEDTGLSVLWLQDLLLKVLYFEGYISGFKVAEAVALPFTGVVDQVLESLKREKLVEVKTTHQMGLGEGAYVYGITGGGIAKAREALDRSQYAGPAPVPLDYYIEACRHQLRGRFQVSQRIMRQALGHLVLGENTFHHLGPAINSGASVFLYGPPGNGKTSVARTIGNLILNEHIYIPYAIYVDGQVIKVYDSVNHQLAPEEEKKPGSETLRVGSRRDPRWIRIRRPFIVAGGELTLADLDLVFDETLKFYEAPFQLKSNGGILLIDDFGRQQVRPTDLLNRWIVPLENRIDYLALHNGRKFEVPFDVLVIFSTNLPPKDLVDEAFLRRLRHKIEITDPTFDEFREIWKRVTASRGITYNEQGLAFLWQEWYLKRNRKPRASHPRDLCDHLADLASYFSIEPQMSPEMLNKAAEAYFVEL